MARRTIDIREEDLYEDLAIRRITFRGVPAEIVSQIPTRAPELCPEKGCGLQMKDYDIGSNGFVHFRVRACSEHPFRVWNSSRPA